MAGSLVTGTADGTTAAVTLRLSTHVDRLPDGMREVFMLRQGEGLSTQEVADVLGVSDGVVKTRRSRARATLRRDLARRAGIAASGAFRFLRPRCDRVVAAVFARIGQRG